MELKPKHTYDDQSRLEALIARFKAKYVDNEPEVIVRVPGRVNLIGEHIDYCGYGVHPMAIEQDVLVAVRKNSQSSGLNLGNLNRDLYSPFTRNLSGPDGLSINLDGTPHWWDYFLCGIKGISEEELPGAQLKGMDCFVDGRIPPSAGLSSSSAMVVSAAISTAWANSVEISKSELADLCARAERHIGTQGGGMDQAIEILAVKGSAKMIEFNPLRTYDVALPAGASFVVANSLAECNKAAGADYNTRVVECKLATKLLGKLSGIENWTDLERLHDYQSKAELTTDEAIAKTKELLHSDGYSIEEVCKLLELSEEDFKSKFLSARTEGLVQFQLQHRALHVYSEAGRVVEFRRVCGSQDDSSLQILGQLMNDSHRSCRDDYECSHPQLDTLTTLALKHGALGARLTGAGWGGCIVALVQSSSVGSFIAGLKTDYYKDLPAAQGRDLDEVIFPTGPGEGAYIMMNSEGSQ